MEGDARVQRAGSFGAEASAYDRGRPEYPPEALTACLPTDARRALDLAAGTGKLACGLLALGLDVVAVEPIDGMRALLPPSVESLAGTAESIPLPDGSVDAVLVGQAFHWFDHERALAEIARVLRPGGAVGLMWNLLDDSVPWVAAIADAFDAEDRASLADPATAPYSGVDGLSDPERMTVRHTQRTNADLLVDNVASRSTSILLPEDERAARLAAVRRLAPAGDFDLPYVCELWRGFR